MPTSGTQIDTLGNKIFEKITAYAPDLDLKRIKTAFDFAKQAHQGQLRRSGEPYIIHPLRTVEILTRLHVDEDTVIAALLHDVPEDTPIPISEIEAKFGPKVSYLVDGITKLSKVHYREQMEERQVESLKKLFIHSAEDLRVILIKLADRLDNCRTLRFITNEKKRTRIARETLEIYVPISNLLGIGEIRTELEDLCFEFLHTQEYARLKKEVEENIEERNFILEEMMHLTEKELKKHHIDAEIVGRPKTLASIYRKLEAKQSIYHMEDLIAIRVIVPTRTECYETLGIIHGLFKPKTGRIKDYISMPKPNGYQSLHSTVFGIHSSVVEFQVRTRYMHLEAEYGIAAHYFYKYNNEQELTSIMQQRSSWVQRILEMQKEHKDPTHFIQNLKLDIFQDRIFVFSPKGDVIDLPRGACAVDFAYAIHSDVGNRAQKAEINGAVSSVTTALSTGDTVQIITDPHKKPEREWLNFAKTNLAVTKIKDFLSHQPLEVKRAIGKKFLQKEFDRIGKNFINELTAKKMLAISQKLPYKHLDDLMIAVGEGALDPEKILELLYQESKSHEHKGFFYRTVQNESIPFRSRVGLLILGDNSKMQFREILRTLNALNIPILKFIIDKPWYLQKHRCDLSILVKNYNELAQVFESLEQLEGVEKISRLFLRRQLWFALTILFTVILWLIHPLAIHFVLMRWPFAAVAAEIILYGGILMLFKLVFSLKNLAARSFPEFAETAYYWPIVFAVMTLALFTVIGEILTFQLSFNWPIVLGLIVGVYAFFTASYLSFKKETQTDPHVVTR